MLLSRLTATNFRNLVSVDLSFAAPVTALIGDNAQGKTNILEAIQLLAIGKSLHATEEAQLIRRGEEFFRVRAEVATDVRTLEIAAVRTPRFTKVFKANDKKVTASDFVGGLPTVTFFPTDLNLVLLAPSLRRRYLDILLAQVSRAYLRALTAYTRALRQRNALLALIADRRASAGELAFWDEELATHGIVIAELRNAFLDESAEELATRFVAVSGTERQLTARLTNFHAHHLTIEKYREHLDNLRERDIRYRTTTYGPHRTDLVFALDGEDVADDGSRGEVRSVILALKFAELSFLEARTGSRPLLLLDDVFSELDPGRRARLMEMLTGYQTVIATTEHEHLAGVTSEMEILTVENGSVSIAP